MKEIRFHGFDYRHCGSSFPELMGEMSLATGFIGWHADLVARTFDQQLRSTMHDVIDGNRVAVGGFFMGIDGGRWLNIAGFDLERAIKMEMSGSLLLPLVDTLKVAAMVVRLRKMKFLPWCSLQRRKQLDMKEKRADHLLPGSDRPVGHRQLVGFDDKHVEKGEDVTSRVLVQMRKGYLVFGCPGGAVQKSTDRLVRSADVPSGSIQTRHQDPEGHFINRQSCAQAIRSPDGGHQDPEGLSRNGTRGTGTLKAGSRGCALSGSIQTWHQES
ncbi:hypothetical protein ACLOJK_034359 [Asimina triloba]